MGRLAVAPAPQAHVSVGLAAYDCIVAQSHRTGNRGTPGVLMAQRAAGRQANGMEAAGSLARNCATLRL